MPELLSAYQFCDLDQLPLRRARMLAQARELNLAGTVLLATEGINFSLGGEAMALDAWLESLAVNHGIADLTCNRQSVDQVPFLRLKVRIRPEIITFDPDLRPGEVATGQALAPSEWHRMLLENKVQLVDTRNHYEYELGTFVGALDPDTETFTEFRDWALANLEPDQPVAMFCTGGVRCEKASAWLLANGFEEVYQLDGGILSYMQSTPVEQSLWHGECFVFDDRVSVDEQLRPTGRPVCVGCRLPVAGLDDDDMPPVDNNQCRLCQMHLDAARLAGLRERARQIALARSRGLSHLGPQAQPGSADKIDKEGTS